jgi:hypothetical protein
VVSVLVLFVNTTYLIPLFANLHRYLGASGKLSYELSLVGSSTGSLFYVSEALSDDTSTPSNVAGLMFEVTDSTDRIVAASNYTTLTWYSVQGWNTEGTVCAASLFELYDGNTPSLSWNATGVMSYADAATYSIAAWYNPLSLQSYVSASAQSVTPLAISVLDKSSSSMIVHEHALSTLQTLSTTGSQSRKLSTPTFETDDGWMSDSDFLIFGFGGFSGSASQFDLTLTEGKLVLNRQHAGYATGSASYDFSSAVEHGLIQVDFVAEDGSQALVFQNHGLYSYDVTSTTGQIVAKSAVNAYGTPVEWNTTVSFTYGGNAYSVLVHENNYDTVSNNIVLEGSGGYGGSYDAWWWSLADSELIYYDSIVGHAQVALTFSSTNGVQNANTSYVAYITDAGRNPVIDSIQYLAWSTDSSLTADGTIALHSHWNYMDSFAWNVSSALLYNNNVFGFYIDEADYLNGASAHVEVLANGTYGGNIDQWTATLTDGTLTIDGSLVGSASATIDGDTPYGWTSGTVQFATNTTNGNGAAVMKTGSTTTWSSGSTWTSEGMIAFDSLVDVIGVTKFNTTGSFIYADDEYHFGVDEVISNNDATSTNDFVLYVDGNYLINGGNDW